MGALRGGNVSGLPKTPHVQAIVANLLTACLILIALGAAALHLENRLTRIESHLSALTQWAKVSFPRTPFSWPDSK